MRPIKALAIALAVILVQAAAPQRSTTAPVIIPFELVTRHIVVQVTVNKSRPLAFVLDTGADTALIRMDVAKELGLTLEGRLNVGGAGAATQTGAFVKNADWSLVGLPGFSQPLAFAIPLTELPAGMGRAIDGIIGGRFIREFVVEVDYQTRRLAFHNPKSFA